MRCAVWICFASTWCNYVQQFGMFLLPGWEDYVHPIPVRGEYPPCFIVPNSATEPGYIVPVQALMHRSDDPTLLLHCGKEHVHHHTARVTPRWSCHCGQ
ncbi:hypothetical protein EDB85DRAFT_1024320 [Lactarius pseudohatsudake]|nr:hypothetical protein EDB85DRAFT_1024320 [Lactarius pseudohatsudake]